MENWSSRTHKVRLIENSINFLSFFLKLSLLRIFKNKIKDPVLQNTGEMGWVVIKSITMSVVGNLRKS